MKFRSFIVALAFSLPAMALAFDEIKEVELNNGTVYKNCAISEETDEYLILDVPQEGKTIKEEKKIQKSDIKKIVRPSEEEVAYKRLERLFLDEAAVNEQSVSDLDMAIGKFLKKFPNSPGKGKIEAEQAKNKEIMTHVTAGEIKLDGKWITKAEQERIAYSLFSKRYLALMKANAASKNYRMALNFYEKIKSDFPASEAFVEADKLVRKVCPLYEKQLQEQFETAKQQSDAELKEIQVLSKIKNGRERQDQLRKAQADKRNAFSEKVAQERASNIRWTSVNPDDPGNIQVGINLINNQISQFKRETAKQPDPNFIPADILFVEFWKAYDAGDYKITKEIYDKLRTCRLQEEYKNPIEKAKEELREKTEKATRDAKDKAAAERKAEADKRAEERRIAREKAAKIREENARKAQEAKEKRNKGGSSVAKPGDPAAKPGDPAAPASPAGAKKEAPNGALKDFE